MKNKHVILSGILILALLCVVGIYALNPGRTLAKDLPAKTEAPAEVAEREPASVATEEVDASENLPAEKEVAPATKIEANEKVAAADNVCPDLKAKIDTMDFDGLKSIRQGLPAHDSIRDRVLVNGATGSAFVVFGASYQSVTVDRVVGDDQIIEVIACIGGQSYDLLPFLGMTEVTIETLATMDPNLRLVMETRGVDVENGELLAQNSYSIYLGAVKEGDFLYIVDKDDPKLGDNNGGLLGVVGDKTYFTRDVNGNFLPVEDLTFFPDPEIWGETFDETAYFSWVESFTGDAPTSNP